MPPGHPHQSRKTSLHRKHSNSRGLNWPSSRCPKPQRPSSPRTSTGGTPQTPTCRAELRVFGRVPFSKGNALSDERVCSGGRRKLSHREAGTEDSDEVGSHSGAGEEEAVLVVFAVGVKQVLFAQERKQREKQYCSQNEELRTN
ncbi:hypothetical protein QOT17_015639 [Balamuthia mandrillaris]